MPVLIAPLLGFALGTLLGFALGLPDRAADLRFGRSVVLWFAVLGFAPVPAYFAWSVPSWSFAYVVNGDRVPSAASLAAVIASAGFVVLGFEVAQRAIADDRPRGALAAGFGAAALGALIVTGLASKLWLVGSYAEVTGGFAVPSLGTTSTGVAVLGLDTLLGAATWIALSALRGSLALDAREPPATRSPAQPRRKIRPSAGPPKGQSPAPRGRRR